MGPTQRLARFASSLRYDALPLDVVHAVKRALLDTLGVALAGAGEEGSAIVAEYARLQAASPEATVLAAGFRTTAAQAALVNGAFGHALDFDDVAGGMQGHPSVPLAPAVLALAEKTGASGADVIAAFAAGFEVECKLGRAMGRSGYARGWHMTSVLGSLGAAAACANLLRLDEQRTRYAIAIAASMASGSRQNFGTMTKPLHAGLAARAGVEAALLAGAGFTADPEVIEAPLGFAALFTPAADARPGDLAEPGEQWEIVIPGISVKKYPCCYMTHRALDATLAATAGRPLVADEVVAITVRVPEGSTSALIHHRPTTGLEGKFSMEYCVAAAALDGGIRFSSFDQATVLRPEAQALLRRVTLEHTPRSGPGLQPASVSLRLRDGRELAAEVLHERGNAADPLSDDELDAKYRDCAAQALAPVGVERSLRLLRRLEGEASLRELMATLATAADVSNRVGVS